MGLIVCPLSADYRANDTASPCTVKPLFQLTLLVNGVFLTPLTMLFKLNFTLYGLLILAGIVILTPTDATLQGY